MSANCQHWNREGGCWVGVFLGAAVRPWEQVRCVVCWPDVHVDITCLLLEKWEEGGDGRRGSGAWNRGLGDAEPDPTGAWGSCVFLLLFWSSLLADGSCCDSVLWCLASLACCEVRLQHKSPFHSGCNVCAGGAGPPHVSVAGRCLQFWGGWCWVSCLLWTVHWVWVPTCPTAQTPLGSLW